MPAQDHLPSKDTTHDGEKTALNGFHPIEVLPDLFPLLRPVRPDEQSLLFDWLRKGRAERAFRKGDDPTVRSVRDYRRSLTRDGWSYRVLTVEVAETPVGYVDYRWRRTQGEILGLYLDHRYRNRRLGRHILAVVLEHLRSYGCRNVHIEIYSDNAPSQRAAESCGFGRWQAKDRDEDGRVVLTYRSSISPLLRLQPSNPRYKALAGHNIVDHHLASGMALARKLQDIPGVEAVIGLGSIGRNFADDSSDIDIMVLGRGTAVIQLQTGEHFVAGTSVDIFAVDLESAPVASWSRERREAVLEGVVLVASPNFDVRRLTKDCRLSPNERRLLVCDAFLRLGWIGFQPAEWDGQLLYGYKWTLVPNVWQQRGCLDCAHQTVDDALDLALQALYAVNHVHLPDRKWRLFLASGLPWQPRRFHAELKSVLRPARASDTYASRVCAVRRIVSSIGKEAVRRRLLGGDIYAFWRQFADDYATTR